MLIGNKSKTAQSDRDLWATPWEIFHGVKILKKYWFELDKETQGVLKTEIKGRIKHLKNTHPSPRELHYFKSYSAFIEWLEEQESKNV